MTPTTIGIVGTGSIATTMHIPLLRAMDSARITWIADVDENRAREVGRINRLSFVRLDSDPSRLPPCDIVLLSIPLLARRAYLDHYMTTETAVFVEKPLAIDATEHARLLTSFESWRLMVGYQRRFYTTSQLMRSLILSGTFGALLKIFVAEGGRVTRTGGSGAYQDESVVRGGGIIKNLGCHSLDLILWLTGATEFRIKDRHVVWDGDTDRSGNATITLSNVGGMPGADCDLFWTVSSLEAQTNSIQLQFERATLNSSIAPTACLDLLDRDRKLLARLSSSAGATTSLQAFYLEWNDTINSFKQRHEPLLSGRSCLAAAQLMDQLLER